MVMSRKKTRCPWLVWHTVHIKIKCRKSTGQGLTSTNSVYLWRGRLVLHLPLKDLAISIIGGEVGGKLHASKLLIPGVTTTPEIHLWKIHLRKHLHVVSKLLIARVTTTSKDSTGSGLPCLLPLQKKIKNHLNEEKIGLIVKPRWQCGKLDEKEENLQIDPKSPGQCPCVSWL